MEQRKSTAAVVAPSFTPRMPTSIKETGLGLGFLTDLALKIMYFEGNLSGYDLAERMKLPYVGVIDQVLEFLKREKLCEVKGAGGFAEAAYQYAIAEKGRSMGREALARSQYAGAAPVTLETYYKAIHNQPLGGVIVHQRKMRQALSHMVINEETFSQLGPAVNSGRSIFLFGHPGNGKTAIAESIGEMILGDAMYIPHAVEIGGQIIRVFDSVNHVVVDESANQKIDPRWVRIRRPVIITGGELTLEALDLVYDENNKYYEAPFQMKANGGMFLIDDFGRQQARPRDLLNRWIVPLEKRVDFLTLHTGRKIEVPFDVLIVFSTNLAPRDLVDEAFLRRIRHKIEIGNPSWDEYREIFRRMCQIRNVPYDDRGLAYLIQEHYLKSNRSKRACHPRDLIDQLIDIARYLNVPVKLNKDLIDRACEAYFVEL
ncbi:MAG: AAA family ATPase [Anaerolineaceae bacterium 4572_32.2]|nr:MAG: AAA family ATPase [Anaerolineaceae bacterium 4572_32.2]RLC82213.1 MAG: ATP-binding protein [Chloroflexota bacterium]HEY73482.1 ATP-binding protein [Thermoflexia bacterium]